jgi:uncharacterized protein with NRDE domain
MIKTEERVKMTKEQRIENLMTIAGDECATTLIWKANVAAFVATCKTDEAAWAAADRLLGDVDTAQDIREEGAGVWDFWTDGGLARRSAYAPLMALRA